MSRREKCLFPGALIIGVAISLACGAFVSARAESRVEIHYAPAENLERIDVSLIAHAARTLDIAAYVLTDKPVIEALAAAARRGVAIRLYRDPSERPPGQEIAAALDALLAEQNVAQRFKSDGGGYMHLKSYCVDDRLLRTGAANFSASGLKRQNNDLVVIEGPGACANFNAAFGTMWGLR